ncbi:hypothetical protein D9Q98_004102 [Chlorella vulgaris]|uniref:3'-phosphate/5'-hydroxy nucleic acid ligase n=1 Tax=Chlorella vulgaris TaxID=3077 RepID=A0A9D4TR79_CHLVU|nr:hypothetical protein D9Q98_004102 [Chlorella vulgaris]
MSGACLLKTLGYDEHSDVAKTELAFEVDGLVVTSDGPSVWRIDVGLSSWRLESKVVLNDDDLKMCAHIVARMAPVGSTARLQADAHRAGTVFIGLVLNFEDTRIPVNLVSADIGCGLTLVPVVDRQGRHLTEKPGDNKEYHSYVLACIRRSLKRGKIAEKGLTPNEFLKQASAFYGDSELETWLHEMTYVLDSVGIDYGGDVLGYIGRFCQSLGSSGNHFFEVAVDKHDAYYCVVHSGSRALGAMVYSAIAWACRATADGYEIATGALAEFYTRAYDALNKFAKLNRVICAVAVLDNLGLETSAHGLRDAFKKSKLFAPAVAECPDDPAVMELMGGLTHNGLKSFVNDADRTVMYVMSKGAIAVSRRASSAIVALRAGEGCVAFTLVDPCCPWREVPTAQAAALGYTPVLEANGGIVFAGHGAGRTQSATQTEKQSSFQDLEEFFEQHDMVGNIAPGVLGDNPAKAYKPSAEILQHLPLDDACTWSYLRTRVAHKEGLCYKRHVVEQCAAHIQATDYEANRLLALVHDLNLVRGAVPEDEMERRVAKRDEVMGQLEAKYRPHIA